MEGIIPSLVIGGISLVLLSSCSVSTYFTTTESGSTIENHQEGPGGIPPGGFGSGSPMNGNAMPPPGSGNSNANVEITAGSSGMFVSGSTKTRTGGEFVSNNIDESAIVADNQGSITISNAKVTKSGDVSNTENSEFYGLNAGVIAKNKSSITLSDSTVTTNAKGANGIFATSESTVNLKNVAIKTTAESGSRGIDATYGGTINADNIKVSTVGAHSAAIATDRGEGNINVENSTLETSGTDSPVIYSTGEFKIKKTTGVANGAEAAVIEGQNSITLTDCILTGMKNWGVMIYQSFSGDAEGSGGIFTMEGGSLAATDGPLFYSTNTTGYINLKNVTLKSISGVLLKAEANSRWGKSGSNGSIIYFETDSQKMEGSITADAISSISIIMKNNSSLIGTINTENTAKELNVSIDSSSSWTVTNNSHIHTLSGIEIENGLIKNIIGNGYNVYYKTSSNGSLGGKIYHLTNGGELIPE